MHDWYGIAAYITHEWADTFASGVRLEWFRDDDGSRVATSAREPQTALPGSSYYAATVGLQ